jgi:hypothetical protein
VRCAKHDRVREFGAVLPRIREVICGHLEDRGLTRSRVLATAIRLIDLGFFRPGGKEYAEEIRRSRHQGPSRERGAEAARTSCQIARLAGPGLEKENRTGPMRSRRGPCPAPAVGTMADRRAAGFASMLPSRDSIKPPFVRAFASAVRRASGVGQQKIPVSFRPLSFRLSSPQVLIVARRWRVVNSEP